MDRGKMCFMCKLSAKLLIKVGEDENSFYACENCVKELAISVEKSHQQPEFMDGNMLASISGGLVWTQWKDITGRWRTNKSVHLTGSAIVTDIAGYQFEVMKGDVSSLMKFWDAFLHKQVSYHNFRLVREVLT